MIKFNSQGVYASNSKLASIAAECLQAERDRVRYDRLAREAGATCGTWDVDDISREAIESVGFFAAHYGEL